MKRIYLDHSATTPLHPLVLEAMLPIFQEQFGNPSSLHSFGRAARHEVNKARDMIASLLRCRPSDLIFTSGGTESDNLALLGSVHSFDDHRGDGNGQGHVITSQVEHHAVLATCRALEKRGYDVTYLPVDSYGQIDVADVAAAIREDTHLISIMYVNNEVGTIQPIEAVGKLAREHGITFHVDAVQALGKIAIDLSALPVDLMSFSAHKINGPKGIGMLYVAPQTRLQPMLLGGLQERKQRAGTENVAGIVGFAKALEIALDDRKHMIANMERLRQVMIDRLAAELAPDSYVINGHPQTRLPHILNMSFPAVSAETMLMSLDLAGIAASSGSACSSGSLQLSHVITAMGLPHDICESAVRFSFGLNNTEEEIVQAAQTVATIVKKFKQR